MIDIELYKQLKFTSGKLPLQVKVKLKKGSFNTIYGDSGAGKTSLLRMIASLIQPDKGFIKVEDKLWFDSNSGVCLKPQLRKIGFVFQDYALFPNMSVVENLYYASAKKKDEVLAEELVDLMELKGLEQQKPHQLSGGQQQRVALARAFMQKPDLLLLDEPFSAIDQTLKEKLLNYLLKVHKSFGFTTIMISHSVSDIIKLSDRVLVLEQGRVVNDGTPKEVFSKSEVSGKFKFTGQLVEVIKQDFMCILLVLIGKDLVKVVADEEEVAELKIGDQLLVAAKAFNPIIKKL